MMIHEAVQGAPRTKPSKRKGRGESSGHGKTSGRGNKGSGARTGTYIKRGYEGGQTPIFKRFPKRGFSNQNFEHRYYIVNLQQVDELFDNGATVDPVALKDKGLIPDFKLPVKILCEGKLTKKLTILAGWYSKSAHAKILKVGGIAQNSKGEVFEFPKPKKKFVLRDPVKKVKAADEVPAEASAAKPVDAKAEAKPAAE